MRTFEEDADQTRQEAVHAAWSAFIAGGPADGLSGVARPVLEGWERSRELGVDPFSPKDPPVLAREDLERLPHYRAIRSSAAPMLDMLGASIHGTGYIATLALASGHIAAVVGDDDMMLVARRSYNVPGALRSVRAVGSSALSLCLAEKTALQIAGYEHYCRDLHEWRCSAAPIFGRGGELVGVLAISSDISRQDIHTLTLAKSCADGIGIRLRENALMNDLQHVNATLQSTLDTLPEAVVTVAEDGTITHANSNAAAFRPQSAGTLVGKTLGAVFPESDVGKVMQIMRKSGQQSADLEVKTAGGPQNRLCRFIPIRLAGGRYGGTIISIPSRGQLIDIAKHVSGNYAKYSFSDIKGKSENLVKEVELARRAAATAASILLTGESGTGKELFAQAIHNASAAASGPFVAISCAAIPRDLIESELFGYVGGAFTGARRNGMLGKVELASGGTLFLDEINSLPLDMQAKLLRVLQQREIVRIGDTKPTPVDIRVIAATNADLKAAMNQGLFRGDLYYRINVVEITIPPLRERRGDIELLAGIIVGRLSVNAGLPVPDIARDAIEALEDYSWPGNVRELYNTCERALLVSGGGTIEAADLPAHIRDPRAAATMEGPKGLGAQAPFLPQPGAVQPSGPQQLGAAAMEGAQPPSAAAMEGRRPLEETYRDAIAAALARCHGNCTRAAAELGIARSTLYRKLRGLRPRQV